MYSCSVLTKCYSVCGYRTVSKVLVVNTWLCVLSTVLAVERVSEEDVMSGFYHFPASTDING